MSDSTPWQIWRPDDLLPAPDAAEMPAELPAGLPPDTAPAEEVLSDAQQLAQQLAQAQQRAHEQGYAAGLAEGHSAGHASGFAQGLSEGLAQGLAQAREEQAPVQAQMQLLLSEFQHTLDALDGAIASRLMQIALAAARQVLGQAPAVDGSALIQQIQQLLQQEPLFSGKPLLRVHPDDLVRVEEMLGATLNLHGWRLRGDPALHRGGCKVAADEGDLDASLATRWQELCRLAAPGVL
ncbi:flagellar assembly protein FliH [Pluralibacter gergoviae]|uniref:flagellar assembly protein FliH n=1 Tax=Pluralibacter gergoviae TaxID=61647 RepID=UPI0006AC9B27|nr:flagellar assembly protein FliH [Pluralibacter gergoviae]EKV0929091.1 flagellar assembly protein FliH [Pluralibacter gergoviae]EKV6245496.1 flagellar assembly protein FliH [Pluralibacter gergoviae]EKW6619432.1 flagellar assembly protein FliH [Pluralibacter gergoviae]EKW9966200.1 flagellar assembly protein FliH [Pluralibacter gergoviae]ELD4272139.1 flagellar assembly protein FliH [Pluralibacter gergoviae]